MKRAIEVKGLSKVFTVRKTGKGVWGAFKGLFNSECISLEAIKNVELSIAQGERVAFIGPNGAGKSTMIKMLTGILYPTMGEICVLGYIPWKERGCLSYEIGTVFGQRTQLWYHLPPSDTFDLLLKMYDVKERAYLEELIELFEIESFLDQPVRQLSLGQRMRCELVASLLHKPRILFLDEPTIGLDIEAKLKIRNLLSRLSRKEGITLFLTSHDTADIEQVCDRVIVLDKGRIIQDCTLFELKKKYTTKKKMTLITNEKMLQIPGIVPLESDDYRFTCELTSDQIEPFLHAVFKLTAIKDVQINDPTMEEIIRDVYGSVSKNH